MEKAAILFFHSASHMSSAISPDRIIECAKGLATTWINQEHRSLTEAQAAKELFDSQKPALLAAAKRQHEQRFTPLRAIIDPLIPAMQALRDVYFPGRVVAVAEAYLEEYNSIMRRKSNNRYARGAMVVIDKQIEDKQTRGVVYAIATCVEPPDRRWIRIGPSPKPRYYLNLGVQEDYFSNDHNFFKMLLEATDNKDVDHIDLTEAGRPFNIVTKPDGSGRVSFKTMRQILPEFHYRTEGIEGHMVMVVANPATFIAEHAGEVEGKFSEVLAPWARRQLMAQTSA